LPRRQAINVSAGDTELPQMRFVAFQANNLHAVLRFFTWIKLLMIYAGHTFLDKIRGRDTIVRHAVHLRQAFEGAGGSFIKLGIHLSMRLDLIDWTLSNELMKMSDELPPFPVMQAIAIIENSTKKPLSATFETFDPQPITSSSVACIYQAVLLNGEKVAVKVRRPGIGEQFMADVKAFDWLLLAAEFLTIFRPGFSQGMREEFHNLVLEELDFVQEARRQDAFCRAAKESRKNFFSAPNIDLGLSSEEVIVSSFASGMWLWELLAAKEQGNEGCLNRAKELNIDYRKVAKRLLWINYWAREENLFFHANPNTNNIIVGKDSKLYFTNFSTTGNLNRTRQQAMRQNLHYAWQRDPQNMARALLILIEPLPQIDPVELTQKLETYCLQLVYALEADPYSIPWQERTSVIQWIGLVQLAHQYGISIDIEVLRMLRATLLVESIAVRLDREIDFVKEYRRFYRYKAEQARRRVTETVLDRLEGKSNEQLIIRMDRVFQTLENLYFRTIHSFSLPSVNFNKLMSKWSYFIYMILRIITQAFFVTVIAVAAASARAVLSGATSIDVRTVAESVIRSPLYFAVLLLLVFFNGRAILFRLDDKEV
jgi:ubiquinone biosynthesis protein